MSAQTTKPPCTYHTDCFAHKDGRCNCLSKTDFVFRDCPFYKIKESENNDNRKQR